jgi:hypothetical protein
MGILNLDIKEGSFDDIGASGTLDGMCEDFVPSWQRVTDAVKILNDHFEAETLKDEWNYEG